MTSTIVYASSTLFPFALTAALTTDPRTSSVATSTSVDTAAIASAASAAVARFEADFYPDWFDHVTYTFIALFATFIVVCYGMVWYKIRVADRKMEERERGSIDSAGWRRRREDEGSEVGTDDDSTYSEDLERGRYEGPRRSSSLSSSLSSEMATRPRGQSRSSQTSYSEEQYSDVQSDLESAPRRRRRRTRTRSSASESDFSFTSSAADTADSTDHDDLSPVRPSTTRCSLPRQGRAAAAEWDDFRAVRYFRQPGRSSEKTSIFG